MSTLFQNARIFTGTDLEWDSTASLQDMLINKDVIEYIGPSNHEIFAGQKSTSTIDLQGRIVVPGFVDGHMHLLMFGSALQKTNLSECANLDDIRRTIRVAAAAKPDAPRILCRGWMHTMTGGIALASMLDDLDERPIFIDSKDLHSTWCNSAALSELGVEDMPDPPGGQIHRDQNGKAIGLLSESANVNLVWPHLAKLASMDDRLISIREAFKAYHSAGYTGMIDMAMDEVCWAALTEMKSRGDLKIRLAAHWIIFPSKSDTENMAQVDRAIALHQEFNLKTSPDFRIAGIKLMCDGVIDACTAALCKPYNTTGSLGELLWDAERLQRVVQRADAAGLQCALHAIGDAAVKLAIDSLELVGTPGRRHRIEHLELTSPNDAQRLSELGITASVQAVHADPAILRAWPDLLGQARCDRAFAYREFLDSGAPLALGTDAPTAPHLPLANLYIAATRRSAKEPSLTETVNPNFALTLGSALSAASAGSAYSCFAEKRIGSLEVGKKADFAVLDFAWNPEKLLQAKVVETWFGGEKVFDSSVPLAS